MIEDTHPASILKNRFAHFLLAQSFLYGVVLGGSRRTGTLPATTLT